MDKLNYDVMEGILNFCDIDTINNFRVAFPDMDELSKHSIRKYHGLTQYLKIKKIKGPKNNHFIYCSCHKDIKYIQYIKHYQTNYHTTNSIKTTTFYNPTKYELLYDSTNSWNSKEAAPIREIQEEKQRMFINNQIKYIRDKLQAKDNNYFDYFITIDKTRATLKIVFLYPEKELFEKILNILSDEDNPITEDFDNKNYFWEDYHWGRLDICRFYNK